MLKLHLNLRKVKERHLQDDMGGNVCSFFFRKIPALFLLPLVLPTRLKKLIFPSVGDQSYCLTTPYLDLAVFLPITGDRSNFPLIHLYFTPGKSLVLPPLIITTLNCSKLCPIPGI